MWNIAMKDKPQTRPFSCCFRSEHFGLENRFPKEDGHAQGRLEGITKVRFIRGGLAGAARQLYSAANLSRSRVNEDCTASNLGRK
jgi:hypothetical protein